MAKKPRDDRSLSPAELAEPLPPLRLALEAALERDCTFEPRRPGQPSDVPPPAELLALRQEAQLAQTLLTRYDWALDRLQDEVGDAGCIWEWLGRLALDLTDRGAHEEALAVQRAVTARHGAREEDGTEALILARQGRRDEALQAVERAERSGARNVFGASVRLAEALLLLDEQGLALRHLEEALRSSRDDEEEYEEVLGDVRALLGGDVTTIRLLRSLVEAA